MTTLPALPLPTSAEKRLAQLLLNESGTGCDSKPRLEIAQSTSGEWSLSASSDLRAEAIERALAAASEDEIFYVPSEEIDIMPLIAELKAMASKPPWMDPADTVLWEQGLRQAMTSYPLDVVKVACKRWRLVPDHGKWWPTEQDLRQQCEIIFRPRKELFNKARLLLQDLRTKESEARETQERSAFATDKGRAFREEMRKRFKPARFDAYFHPSQVQYAEGVVHVRTQTAERVLTEEGGDLLARYGLRVEYTPQAFTHVRQPTWEDDTEAERAEVTRKFNRLKAAMASGENLKRLRASGEI